MKSHKETQVQKYIVSQKKRENEQINLIASESYAPQSVLDALGSILTNKYSEGYPGKRYYPGNTIYDEIELLAQQRALDLFRLSPRIWSTNVQSYSGAIANAQIYAALLEPGNVILSLDLASGGHLSHGSRVSITSKLYTVYHYGVDKKYRIDYKQLEELARIHKPKLIISGASAYPFKINFKKIGAIAKRVNAYHLADISHYAGLVSAGVYPSPFTIADVVMSTTHKSLCGPRGAIIWSRKELSEKINKAVFPGTQGGPHMNTIAALAEGLEIAQKSKAYYIQVIENMKIFVSEFKRRGQIIVGGGSESHMLLLDVRPFGLHGGDAEFILSQVGILANRNIIVGDSSVQRPSAIRIGTYAITQRGMKERQIKQIVQLMCSVLEGKGNIRDAQRTVKKITQTFPILR